MNLKFDAVRPSNGKTNRNSYSTNEDAAGPIEILVCGADDAAEDCDDDGATVADGDADDCDPTVGIPN